MITCKQLAHFEHVKIQSGVDMRKNLGVGIQVEYCLLLYVSQGYSLSGHCSVLLLSTIFDHYGSPSTFYIMWLILGGFSAMRMVSKYYTDCNQKFSAANFKILQVTLSRNYIHMNRRQYQPSKRASVASVINESHNRQS